MMTSFSKRLGNLGRCFRDNVNSDNGKCLTYETQKPTKTSFPDWNFSSTLKLCGVLQVFWFPFLKSRKVLFAYICPHCPSALEGVFTQWKLAPMQSPKISTANCWFLMMLCSGWKRIGWQVFQNREWCLTGMGQVREKKRYNIKNIRYENYTQWLQWTHFSSFMLLLYSSLWLADTSNSSRKSSPQTGCTT